MMKQHWFRLAGLVLLALALVGCMKPETPPDVAAAFWESVIEGDLDGVVEYSTLATESEYDRFSHVWAGATVTWGKLVIDGPSASVDTKVSGVDGGKEELNFVTHLVKEGEDWVVDYEKTDRSINPLGALKELFGGIEKLGEEISRQFQETADDLSVTMESLSNEFNDMADSFEEQARESMERHGKNLQRHLDELASSINRALKEQKGRLSESDRRAMDDLIVSLEETSKGLAQGDPEAVTESGEVVARVQEKLASLDGQTFGQYQDQWREWGEQIASDMKTLVDDVKAGVQNSESSRSF